MATNNRKVNYDVKLNAKVDSSVKKLQKTVDDIEESIDGINKDGISPKVDPKTTAGLNKAQKAAGGLTDKFAGLTSQIPLVGGELAALGGPIGIVAAAVAALGGVLVSTANDISNVRKQLRLLGDESEVKEVTSEVRALQKTFEDLDSKELTKGLIALKKTFGVTAVDAVEKLKQVLIATNGTVDIDNLTEYATIVKQSGKDIEFLTKNIAFANVEGFYQDKGIDAFKNFSEKIFELPKTAKEALKKVGIDGDKLRKQLEDGSIDTEQAFKRVFGNLTSFSKQQQRELQASLTESAGLDVGAENLEKLANNTKSTKELADANLELNKIFEENNKLTTAQEKTTAQLIPGIKKVQSLWREIQIQFFEILKPVIDLGTEIFKMLEDLGIIKVLGVVIGGVFLALKETITTIANNIKFSVQLIRFLTKVVKDSLIKQFENLKQLMIDIFGAERIKKWKDTVMTAFNFIRDVWKDISDFITKTFDKIQEVIGFGSTSVTGPGSATAASSEANDNATNQQGGAAGATPTVDSKVAATLDNKVQSTVRGEVKTISINIDKLQEIATQNINQGDMESFKEQLQIALTSVIADTSQF